MSQVEVAEVSLPQKYINLTKEILEKNPDPALRSHYANKTVEDKLNSDTVTQVTPEYAGDDGRGLLNGDGVFLADMRKLNTDDMNNMRKGLFFDLADFKKHYDLYFFRRESGSKEYSRIVFIKVIEVAVGGRFGRYGTDKKQIFKFYAYHPDGQVIGNCSREIQSDTAHQSAITVPAPCVYNLPVEVLKSHHVNLYKMDIPETLISVAGVGVDSGASASSIADVGSEVGSGSGSELSGGGKLRSAKKTSKRRSVKSKPRYYRRSVGSINHRRKKTTRRRK